MHILDFGGRSEFLRKDQMLEGNWKHCLALKPSVRHNLDKVLRRHRLIQRDNEREHLLLSCHLLFENELLDMKELLRVRVLDKHPERLCLSMDLGLPLEIRSDSQLYFDN